jgi:flagellin-like protein
MKKRGLSPIIATVLLISMALLLAVIIFIWARSFIGEKAQKFGEPVEFSCEDVNFDAEIYGGSVHIVNRGNVPIYGVELKQKGAGSVKGVELFEGSTIGNGETGTVGEGIGGGEFVVVPVVLGEAASGTKAFKCDDKFGLTINA